MLRTSLRAFMMLALVAMLVPMVGLAADQLIPMDRDGLPAWTVKEWTDFPVRMQLDDHAALKTMLQTVEIDAFHREDVGLEFTTPKTFHIVVETRVTEAEFTALENAGYGPERLRDFHRENRVASEKLWADMAAGKSVDVRTDPLNYVPTNDQIGTMLQRLEEDYPTMARYFTWGSSVQGRTIHGIVISDNVNQSEAEPEVRYSSTMHGDEVTGLVMTINLAHYLLEHYGEIGYEDCTDVVDNFELHMVPDYNPDGTAMDQRYNANGVDLNRNFYEPAGSATVQEIENVHFMNYAHANHFVSSINFHGGALVMNYVWDWTYTLAPDNDACIRMCLDYTATNIPMYNGSFPQGITNGADWYVVDGSLQDWVYDQTDCIDTTGEISNIKWPPNSAFVGFWNDNRESLIAYIKDTRDGTIHGVVTDADTGQPVNATITLVGNAKQTHTDPACGDYYKFADDGTYSLSVSALGYVTQTITGIAHTWGTGTTVDVAMQPLATGHVSGTVTDTNGQGLDAMIEIRTWPANELVNSVSSSAADGGAYEFDVFYGDYTLTASAVDHFTESQQATVSDTPIVVDFELGGMITLHPVDEDFEAGMGAFTGEWITATPGYLSDGCLTDGEGNYAANSEVITTVDTVVDLTDVMDPEVMFNAKWSIENSWDAVFFEISTNGGSSWTALAVPGHTEPASGQGAQQPSGTPVFDGSQANWVTCVTDLSAYIGESDVRFRFRLKTDSSQQYDGFYLDNFQVIVVTEDNGGITPVDLPSLTASVEAFPNPFNPQTTVRLVNPRQGHVSVAVFDVQGRLVRELVNADLMAGEHSVTWDGTDRQGRRAGSGVYFARMLAGDTTTGVKLVLVK